MAGDLYKFLARDHERLDALLRSCLRGDHSGYGEFRAGLLRHISIEERVLFPEMRERGVGMEMEQRLHRDHAALAALLVPPPSRGEIEQIAAILEVHNEIEENAGGLYELVESLAGDELAELMARVHAIPLVRLAPHVDNALVRSTIETLLRERLAQ